MDFLSFTQSYHFNSIWFSEGQLYYDKIMQLIEYHFEWLSNQNFGNSTDIVYLDYAKAFDCVMHFMLLHKLSAYGILHDPLNWLKNYLLNALKLLPLMV